jgi:hypothetical protein
MNIMRSMNIKGIGWAGGLALLVAVLTTPASADVVISNVPNGSQGDFFGFPTTTTFGELFTAPTTGTLSSFTMDLGSANGHLIGGIGLWNGGGVSSVLYTSAAVPSATSNTFTPDISVTAGTEYNNNFGSTTYASPSWDGCVGNCSADFFLSATFTTAVPGPIVGAGLPGLILGFAGIGFMAYRRKSKPALMAA